MKLSRKKTFKILAYCATAGIILGNVNLASAEENVRPSEPSSNNQVTLNENNYTINGETTEHDGTFTEFDAGYNTNGDASKNELTVNGGTVTNFLNGGYISRFGGSGYGNTNYNLVIINGGTFGSWVEGGWANYGNANYNTVIINGGYFPLGGIIDGGYTVTGNTNYNTVTINGGTINSNVYGGYVAGSGDAIGNVINITGGIFGGYIYGGYISSTGSVGNNVINISGSPDLSNARIVAARGNSDSLTSYGNKINIYTKNITAKNISGFESLNFYLPANIQNGDTVLQLTDDAESNGSSADAEKTFGTDLSQTQVNLNFSGGANLNPGDTVTLLANSNGLNLSDVENDGIISKGVSLDYGLSLSPVTDSDGNVTAYNATVGDMIGGLKSQTQAFNSGMIDSASLLDSGTDRLLEWLPPESVEMSGLDLNSIPTTGFDPFAGIGGSVTKIKTGPNSYLKTKNGGLNVGMARYLKNRHGAFVFGPVTDYGQDHYNSTMEDGTKGAGNSKYFTAGIIARQMNIGGMYYEGSARVGRINTSYVSDNFLVHNIPTHASYDASAPCYAGHVRVGWRDKISNQSVLDAYGIYSLNRVSGMDATVSTGENYHFSGVNSGRMRLGARLTRQVSEHKRFYSGVAFIHEFTGETRGNYIGLETKKSSLKGNYGLIELGWQTKASKESPVMLDVALVGLLGDHKGLTVNAKFKRDF